MRKHILAAIVAVVALTPTIATANDQFSLSCDVDVFNKYVSGTTPATLDNDPSIQPACTVAHDSGFYFGAWAAIDSQRISTGERTWGAGEEVDYYVGWAGQLTDRLYGRIQASYWDIGPLFKDAKDDSGEIMARLKYDIFKGETATVALYGGVGWQYTVRDPRAEFDSEVGVEVDVPVMEKVNLTTFGEVQLDHGTGGNPSGINFNTGASVSWKITERLTLRPVQLRAIGPITQRRDGLSTQFVAGTGLTYDFGTF